MYGVLSFERRRECLRERRRSVVPSRDIWILPVPIPNVNSTAERDSAIWFPMGRIEAEAPAMHASFCVGPVATRFPAVAGQSSSTFEPPGKKCLWPSGCSPRGWSFEAPPQSWRSSFIPSGGGPPWLRDKRPCLDFRKIAVLQNISINI